MIRIISKNLLRWMPRNKQEKMRPVRDSKKKPFNDFNSWSNNENSNDEKMPLDSPLMRFVKNVGMIPIIRSSRPKNSNNDKGTLCHKLQKKQKPKRRSFGESGKLNIPSCSKKHRSPPPVVLQRIKPATLIRLLPWAPLRLLQLLAIRLRPWAVSHHQRLQLAPPRILL